MPFKTDVFVFMVFFLSAVSAGSFEPIETDYYGSISDVNGYKLKTELHKLLKKTHRDRGYRRLFSVYFKSDIDQTYDRDGSIVDVYSERPLGRDPYSFKSPRQKCGSYRGEADCFNREHLMPQSVFRRKSPMRNDFFHVFPTDGYVNNKRGSLPFGEVGRAKWTSKNGSMVGRNTFGRYSGKVFEPIDEFKGDIARALFYFATRYENKVSGWRHAMLDGSRKQVYSDWFLKLLISWHEKDPVSAHEVRRNQMGYEFQRNRNPFIDHPDWVGRIWKTSR